MACFLVPAAEAVISTIITKAVQKKEKSENTVVTAESTLERQKSMIPTIHPEKTSDVCADAAYQKTETLGHTGRIPFSRKLKWLNKMLWGGTALLAFEHVWHGEVTPWFPFLTAADSPAGIGEMFHEMATVGTMMAVVVTAVWIGMVAVTGAIEKRAEEADSIVRTNKEHIS